jgi:hypothetical protein
LSFGSEDEMKLVEGIYKKKKKKIRKVGEKGKKGAEK